ncbi:MAG: alpha-L-fucosidase [Bacteroidales bacterium]|nr:alpha-L-fucosidase [Bacteroidales bacterium]
MKTTPFAYSLIRNVSAKFFLFFAFFVLQMFCGSFSFCQKPSSAQLAWHDTERIMFVHWGCATWQQTEYDTRDSAWIAGDFRKRMNPQLLNTDQWCQTAMLWGADMIIFVAKHAGGFCWWQTNTSSYGVKELEYKSGKADVLKDLSESCKKYDLKLGVYIYPGDDAYTAGIGSGGICKDTSLQPVYNKIFRQQLSEVLGNYGPISEVWFDGNCKIYVDDILCRYKACRHDVDARAVVFQGSQATVRWSGNEDDIAPYPNWYCLDSVDLLTGSATALASDPFGNAYAPIEIDVPLLKHNNHKWFWAENTDQYLLSVEELMNIYYKSVGRGSVLLLNSTPDTNGLIPASHLNIYKAFGKEINKRFSDPLNDFDGKVLTTSYSSDSYNKKQYTYRIDLKKNSLVNHIVLGEDLPYGQNVLSYRIDALHNGVSRTVCKGTSIGSKRIEYFDSVVADAFELVILSAKDTPHIKNFEAYNVCTELKDLQQQSSVPAPVQVGYWDKTNLNDKQYTSFDLDLTPYAYQVGEYVLSFNQLTRDYTSPLSSALQFKDVSLEIYSSVCNDCVKQISDNQFLITNSQQTLKDFPIRFHVKIKSSGALSAGEITLRKNSFF